MTEEQVRYLIISIDTQLSRFIPRDFKSTIRKTKEYQWAISDIIRSAYFCMSNEQILPLHEYDDLIKSEIDRLSR